MEGRVNIHPSVDAQSLEPSLYQAHLSYKEVVCPDLYDQLIAQTEASTLTAANQLLITKSKDYLVQQTYLYYLLNQGAIAYPKGLRVVTGQNEDLPSVDWLKQMMQQVRSSSEYARVYITRFLCDHQADYPLWNCCSTLASTRTTISAGVQKNKKRY